MIRGYIKRDRKGKFTQNRKRTERNERIERRLKVMALGVLLGILAGISLDVGTREHVIVKEVKAEEVVVDLPEPLKEVQVEVVYNWSEDRINKEIEDKAKEYKVSADLMKRIINCESQGSTTVQSNHRYHAGNVPKGYKVGDREMSFGLSQIHLPAHHVSKEEAINPKFAIDFMAKNIAEGHVSWWSCYTKRMI